MRYNDVRDGTNIVSGVLEKYKAAWDAKGMVQPDGLFVDWLLVKQQLSWPPLIQFGAGLPREIGFTAWYILFSFCRFLLFALLPTSISISTYECFW